MQKWVPVSAKRRFLSWFLDHYRLKNQEVKKLFHFFLSHESILEKVRFTDKVPPSVRTIIASTVCSPDLPFQFRKANGSSYNVQEALLDLKNNPGGLIYIVLEFRGKQFSFQYRNVLETPKPEPQEAMEGQEVLSVLAEIALDRSLAERRLAVLEREIDKSLEAGNKSLFMQLTEERNHLLNDFG
jgi:uncharacterized protein YpiB (UPF0302 family)